MKRTLSQTAKIINADTALVKRWACIFADHLTASANPAKGSVRLFADSDILALCFICTLWEEAPDFENIRIGLNREDHLEDEFRHVLFDHTPLLRELPEDADETWTHGVLLSRAMGSEFLELARTYRGVAESMLRAALDRQEAAYSAAPILFSYRHTLELYLKIIGEIDEDTHKLKRCVHHVEKRYGGRKIAEPVRGWILEMDRIDPSGTVFRYAGEGLPSDECDELWLDLGHFKFAMAKVFDVLDHAILHFGCTGTVVKKKVRKAGKPTLSFSMPTRTSNLPTMP